jgi:hypothetical protein
MSGSQWAGNNLLTPVAPPVQNNLLGQYSDAVGIKNQLLQGQALALQPAQIQQGISASQTAQAGDQLNQNMEKVNANIALLQPLLPMLGKGVITPDAAKAQMALGVKFGTLTPDLAANLESDMPTAAGPQMDSWIQNHYAMNQTALQNITGTPTAVNTGGATSFQNVNPVLGTVTPMSGGGASLPNTLSPGEQVSPVAGVNSDGSSFVEPTAKFAQGSGLGALVPGGQGSAASGPFGNGRYQSAAATGPAPATSSAGLATSLAPGQAASMQETALNSTHAYNTTIQSAQTVPAQRALLGNMETALGNGLATGPGSEALTTTVAGLNRISSLVGGPQIAPGAVANSQEFGKYANQLAIAQQASMGAGTDAKLGTAMAANPNPHLNVPANLQILHVLRGNADATQAWSSLAQQYQAQNGASSFNKFVTDTAPNFDPRVFQYQYMTPEEKTSMLAGLGKQGLSEFKNAYNFSAQNGLLDQYRQAAPSSAPAPAQSPAATPQVPTSP